MPVLQSEGVPARLITHQQERLGCFEATSEPLFLIAKAQSGSESSRKIIAGLAAQSKQSIQTTRALRQMGQQ